MAVGDKVSLTEYLVSAGACWECGITIMLPSNFERARRESGGEFFCPNGHPSVFGKTELEKTKELLETERRWRAREQVEREKAERSARIAIGKLKAQSERVKNGVCPCCKRSFQNLHRHMQTKHRDWSADE